jgi:Late exocytosis, associated with Golgi transport
VIINFMLNEPDLGSLTIRTAFLGSATRKKDSQKKLNWKMVEIAADVKGVISATLLQLSIAVGCFIGFSILRPANKNLYESKRKYAAESKRPIAIGNLPTDWLRPVRTVDEVEILDKCGVDAVMFCNLYNPNPSAICWNWM